MSGGAAAAAAVIHHKLNGHQSLTCQIGYLQYLVSTQVCVIVQYLSPLAHLSPLASTKRQIMVHIQ